MLEIHAGSDLCLFSARSWSHVVLHEICAIEELNITTPTNHPQYKSKTCTTETPQWRPQTPLRLQSYSSTNYSIELYKQTTKLKISFIIIITSHVKCTIRCILVLLTQSDNNITSNGKLSLLHKIMDKPVETGTSASTVSRIGITSIFLHYTKNPIKKYKIYRMPKYRSSIRMVGTAGDVFELLLMKITNYLGKAWTG
jgi:hypothetical protein